MAYKLLGTPNRTYSTRANSYTADAYGLITVPVPNAWDIMDLTNGGCVCLGPVQALNNLSATIDPTSANDQTQDYGPGSVWVNSANGRVWFCQSASTGSAAWALAVVPGTGVEPSANLEQFGSGTGTVLAEGNIYRYASAGVNPAATGSDVVLAVASVPANSFDGTGNRGLAFQMNGSFGNNTNTKRAKIVVNPSAAAVGSTVGTGGTTLADTGAYNTTGLTGFQLSAEMFKYGAANSNTQVGFCTGIVIGAAHGGLGTGAPGAPQAVAAVENAPILVAFTGNAATLASDISLAFACINAMN